VSEDVRDSRTPGDRGIPTALSFETNPPPSAAAALPRALARVRAAVLSCIAGDQPLPNLRDAVARFADAGRVRGELPETLIILLKEQCADLPLQHARAQDDVDRLRTCCVTWLIEAYYGGRAD
jgi:hypothetical protein